MILPYDCVREYLEAHPLVHALAVSPREVHAALVHLEERCTERSEEEEILPRGERPPSGGCAECGGYLLLDEHEGQHVCALCGVVPTRGTINVTPEYRAPAPEPTRKRPRTVPGVPWWMLAGMRADAATTALRRAREDLEQYNLYAGHAPADLEDCARVFVTWSGAAHRRDARLVACLLHPLVRAQFLRAADVRASLRQGRALATIVDPTPAPRFPCGTCGTALHSMRDARFHCRGRRYTNVSSM